jgi:hypothetical protein
MKKNLIILIIIAILATIMYFVSGRFQTQNQPIPCTYESRICPDGSAVGRSGPNCEFTPCPIISQENNQNRTKSPSGYECPESNYVDCMPGPYELKWECTAEYLQWAQKNCPGFQGAAY